MEPAELTRALVGIASHDDETEAGTYIEQWLRERTTGTVTRDRHGNVIARRGSGPQLALVGHHDVVPPADRQTNETGDYRVEHRDGRLYGRGTADMKGAVAAAMCAFRDATLSGGELLFASFVGEETGGRGARGAIEDGFAPDYAIVGEGSTGYSDPGVTDVAVAHKGRRASTVHATGQRAHASEPEAGENAIYRASDAIDTIRGLPAPKTKVLGRTLSGSVAVTEIEGGTAWNVIPDSCSITVDERTVPGERVTLSTVASQSGVTVETEQDLPPMACDDAEFADLLMAVAASTQDGTPEQVSKPHATDAGWLADAGTSCVVCGAAEPGEAHTADESVSLAVVDRCYEIYRQSAEQFATQV
jgi:acetylornithine deacetylase